MNTRLSPFPLRPFLVALSLLICAPFGHAEYHGIIDNLEESLASKSTSEDSVQALLNIFDIKSTVIGDGAVDAATRAYETAMRAKDYDAALEMLRNLANIKKRDAAALDSIIALAEAIPDVPHKKETITFTRLSQNVHYATYASPDEAARYLSAKLDELSNTDDDIYDEIVELHAVITCIASVSHGDLLLKYMQRLGNLIDKLPKDEYALRNWFCVQSANLFSDSGYAGHSIAADKKLLDNIAELQKYYNSKGRPFRNYEANKYIIYNRLLSNWESLPDDEIDDIYEKAIIIKDKDERAKRAYAKSPDTDIFYALHKENYHKAHELIKNSIDSDNRRPARRLQLLKYLLMTSQIVSDHETTLSAALEYNRALEESLKRNNTEKAKELQIVYDTYELRNSLAKQSADSQHAINRLQSSIIYICIGALIGLIILVIILVKQFRHARKLTNSLYETNQALQHESEELKTSKVQLQQARDAAEQANRFKTDFIKSLGREIRIPLTAVNEYSHLIVDCADADKKPYLQHYADLVDQNCEYMTTMLNDVCHLSEIDSDSVKLHLEMTDVSKIVQLSADTVARRLKDGVQLIVDTSYQPIQTITDSRRLHQILTKLLTNAVNHTHNGSVSIDCCTIEKNKTIKMTVTDTGSGIPPMARDRIFERLSKADPESPGLGVGLPLARMLARMLGGDLVLDASYTKGARFILTIPARTKMGGAKA